METILGLVALIAIVSIYVWVRNAFWRAANQKVFSRKGHTRGQAVIKAKTTFVVPGTPASEALRTVVETLGYPTTKPAIAHEMVLLSASDKQAVFALASKMGQVWESRLHIGDESDGAHGAYEVVRWTLSDGVASGWKEMAIVERRIGEIVTSIGGTVKVTVPQ